MFDFMNPQGLECMIMQNNADADDVISLFASAAAQGYDDPTEIEDEVFRQAGVDPSNLTYFEKQRIQEAVNQLWGN
jgi:hypothetical protein